MSCRLPHKHYKLSENEKVMRIIKLEAKVATLEQRLKDMTFWRGELREKVATLEPEIDRLLTQFDKAEQGCQEAVGREIATGKENGMLQAFISGVMPQLSGKDQRTARKLFNLQGGEPQDTGPTHAQRQDGHV
jgi:uncharacterized coiled-coil protein SlyX